MIIFFSCTASEKREKKVDGAKLDLSAHYQCAFDFLDEGRLDSAFATFEKMKNIAVEAKDSLNAASCLIQMAITLNNIGDYLTSQELSLEAHSYLDTANVDHAQYLSSNYNNLGNVTGELKEDERALLFYDQAIYYSGDSTNTKVVMNNKARTLSAIGKEHEALGIYEEILKSEYKNTQGYARALTNYAFQKGIIDESYDPLPDMHKALQTRLTQGDDWGLNSSLAYLTIFYGDKNPDSALYYAERRHDIATALNSVDDRLDALTHLIKFSPVERSKVYFKDYIALNDSIQLVRLKAKNQFALIRYEVEKNKADNLRLQNEVNDKMYRINMQYLLTTAIVVVFALIGVFSFFWYKRRRQRLVLEANNRIKASQLKTSRKVHDVVANGLYRVMTEIENREDIDREGILDRLENMYEKSRDISYEVEDAIVASRQSYSELLGEMLHSYATESRQVIIAGNEADMWDSIAANVKDEIGNVIQELMVNMRKHSQADRVVLRFERQGDRLNIYYIDNGVGFSDDVSKGNGLNNTGTRMENINGTIKFVSERGGGLKVHISIPIR
ncbi:tetratricopeptide repeat-containing sensor histidine kinase [Sphingobacterium faecale]|uniref:histidine kinase n=1 Tax=Sphingobacterium faecale TaxID=2803775 RepID=A0ABS1RAH1_9SPHI|nr:tetratricopeptide repeat-containing sensor histidine kinase [Sphingobacterium faecale]MBL1411022.1 ATP-binding protein [Sphingobacterium faecale]